MPYRVLFFAILCAGAAAAGEIVLPSNVLGRDGPVPMLYRTNSQATGKGELSVKWTDVYGRVVEERKIPFELDDEAEVTVPLDLRRAVAMKNELRVHFSFDGVNQKKERDRREEDAAVTFVARPPERKWRDYVILMWQPHTAEHVRVLKTLGINAGQYNGKNRTPPDFLLDNDLRWYAENISTDFYSEYHRWRPDRPTNWSFTHLKEIYRQNPSKELFKRHPSLSDPAWQEKIRQRLMESARNHSPYRPVFYSLGDEPGIADLSAYWDFDFSDFALAEMRAWLKQRYGTLAKLNGQWGTAFRDWSQVTPETTDEAMARKDENYSAWSDHKEFMDISFARALKMGQDAVRAVDPDAYVGLGGAQMPGWGGYDYWRITQALSALEPYDIGNNVEIIRSLKPELAVVTTSFARGPREKHRVWYELLHGARGQLIWDDQRGFVTKEGAVGERGREVAPYYRELRGGVAALLMNSRRQADPVAVHYSQASMRAEWMLAQKPKGKAWVNRSASTERKDSDFLRLRESWCRLIEDLGLQYNFVAYKQVERGELLRGGYRVLVLPRSIALSNVEIGAIREFIEHGGTVIADGEPGRYDEHSRKRAQPAGDELRQAAASGRGRFLASEGDTLNYHQHRLLGKEGAVHDWARRTFEQAGVRPEFAATSEDGRPVVGVETHVFRNGGVHIIGLLSNPQLRVDELGPPEFRSNERLEKARAVRLALPSEMHVYDVRAGKALGRMRELKLTVDPYEPLILAASAVAAPKLELSAPAKLARGATGQIVVRFAGGTPAATHVLHVEVIDPSSNVVPHYSGTMFAPGGRGRRLLPLAMNDAAGRWRVEVRDVLTGQTQGAVIEVH